jgi:hypothetical protein
VITIFGPNTQPLLTFLARLSDLSAEDIGKVTDGWRQADARDRAVAWAEVYSAAPEREQCWILAAASVARQVALDVAGAYDWTDWGFWAAASDAGAAIVAGDLIGRHYDTLVSPLAAVMPWLPSAHGEVQSWEGVPVSHRPSGEELRQGA